jgi:hypothetical protein
VETNVGARGSGETNSVARGWVEYNLVAGGMGRKQNGCQGLGGNQFGCQGLGGNQFGCQGGWVETCLHKNMFGAHAKVSFPSPSLRPSLYHNIAPPCISLSLC